jgi:glycosyltransferase involved in cell wall biosynthesis
MKISVITVVLNAKDTIAQTIESVLSQSHKNIEQVVIDGGSTDGTLEVIGKYKDKIAKFISQTDRGIYDAMNKGILLSSGEVVGFLNANDMFYDNDVVQKMSLALGDNTCDCVYGNLVYVSNKDLERITRRWQSREFQEGLFQRSWTPAHPTFYCRKVFYERFGLYRTDFKIAADVELMYRFLQKNHLRSRFINAPLVRMRDSGVSNRGIKCTIIITREMRKAIIDNGGKFNLVEYLFFKFLKISEFFKIHGRK